MATILQFAPKVTSDSDATCIKAEPYSHEPSIHTTTDSIQNQQGYIPTEDLYPVRDQFNPALTAAIQLLEEGIDHIKESIRMLLDGDRISSDDAVQRFQALLPELFCCRNIGDGFGTIINSVYHAISNMNDNPLNESQLRSILDILKRILSEPFIEYEEAVDEVMRLESVGFEVSPSHFKFVADLLNE